MAETTGTGIIPARHDKDDQTRLNGEINARFIEDDEHTQWFEVNKRRYGVINPFQKGAGTLVSEGMAIALLDPKGVPLPGTALNKLAEDAAWAIREIRKMLWAVHEQGGANQLHQNMSRDDAREMAHMTGWALMRQDEMWEFSMNIHNANVRQGNLKFTGAGRLLGADGKPLVN